MESGHHSRAQRHGARLAACGGNHLRFWTNLAIHATCVKRMDLPELLQALCGFLQLSLAENGQTHVAVIHSIYRTFWGPVLFSARFSAVMITQRRRHVAPKGRLLHSLPPLPPATISSRHSPLLPGTPHSCTPFLPPPFPFTPATISSLLPAAATISLVTPTGPGTRAHLRQRSPVRAPLPGERQLVLERQRRRTGPTCHGAHSADTRRGQASAQKETRSSTNRLIRASPPPTALSAACEPVTWSDCPITALYASHVSLLRPSNHGLVTPSRGPPQAPARHVSGLCHRNAVNQPQRGRLGSAAITFLLGRCHKKHTRPVDIHHWE